jgi:Flp pilus assembly protein TadD
MSWKRLLLAGVIGITATWGPRAQAGDLKITLPKRSHLTPVQRLNQDGVEAVRRRDYQKAEALFYKAYLLDSDDPFTLNNLGYIAEIQGQLDRAQTFYDLAAQQPTEAVIARASADRVIGRPVTDALAGSSSLEVNHDNVEAVRLLSQKRAPEVDLLLQQALQKDPHNVFTLNNIGVAKEMEGELQEALKYYDAAAAVQSNSTADLTLSGAWDATPVNQIAAQNGSNLRQRLASQSSVATELAELNLRGVSAINRNDLTTADQDFRRAYALDPFNAFAINNIGYVAEIEGDPETAQFFYDRAQSMAGAGSTVGLASRGTAKGQKLFQVASDNDSKIQAKVERDRAARRQQNEPIVLRHRDGTPVEEAIPAPAEVPRPPTQ